MAKDWKVNSKARLVPVRTAHNLNAVKTDIYVFIFYNRIMGNPNL